MILRADVTASGAPGVWTEVHRGTTGDPRGSAQNNVVLEFLGDYVVRGRHRRLRRGRLERHAAGFALHRGQYVAGCRAGRRTAAGPLDAAGDPAGLSGDVR